MRLKKLALILSSSLAMVAVTLAIVIACAPSPEPPSCPQSIYLSKFTPGIVLIPDGGAAFDVDIGIFPYVSWDAFTAACANPVAADLTVTLECTDVAGASTTLSTETYTLPTPTASGAQPQGGMTVAYPIPAGTPPSTCTVMAAYAVDFASGVGAGTLAGTGDTQICLVEPSPGDPSGETPRLDLELLTPEPLPGRGGANGAYTFHAGDQEYIYVRISNNDLENRLEIDFKSTGQQTAVLPFGFTDDADAYNDGVFRISDPADTFPAEFFFDDAPLPFDRVPGTPGGIGDGEINTRIELEPGEVEVFGIAINSFGACADGSCNERDLCGTGLFFDEDGNEVARDPACVQFNYVVDNAVPPRYPGITFEDAIKVTADVDAQWGPVHYFDNSDALLDQTHRGNLLPQQTLPALQGGPAIQTTGDNLRNPNFPFPGTWFDQITLPQPPTSVHWESFFFYQQDGFQQRANQTILNGIDQLQDACEFPVITLNNPLNPTTNAVVVEADVSNGCDDNTPVILREGNQIVVQGTLGQLKQDNNLRVDTQTCRTILPIHNVLDRPFMVADPPFLVQNFAPDAEDPLARAIRILDQLEQELDWRVQYEELGTGGGVALLGTTGRGTSDLFLNPGVLDPADPFDEVLGFLIYENDEAVNSPLAVPVLARRLPAPPGLLPLDFDFGGPPLAQVDQQYDAGILIPPLDPQPVDPYFNMEFFIGIETNDPIEITIPDPFLIIPIDPNTPAPELERLGGKFGEEPISRCSEGVWKCGRIEFGDGFTFESEIFVDGFESGDISSWTTGAAADNSQPVVKEQSVGVLDGEDRLPVITEEELRRAIELFNDDVVFDEKTIGLVSERFDIGTPLPPIRGTYFFDEFESFRKRGAQAAVTLDGSRCPSPCSGLVLEGGDGGINGLRFEGFPDYGVEVASDGNLITNSEFVGNTTGGLLINGSANLIGGDEESGNVFEGNDLQEDTRGGAIVVETGDSNTILFNMFIANAQGIDLGNDGITANDDGDADTGGNQLQNYPVLQEALLGGSSTIIGTFNSLASRAYTLQFFASASDACQTADSRNGELYLGSADVTTDENGNADFTVVVDSSVARFDFVTATATELDHGRTSELSACVQVVTGVATEGPAAVPEAYALAQNYPNPFNPSTTIHYAVPEASRVRLEVFDLLGRLVGVLVDELKAAGSYALVFDAGGLPSGTYLYKMTGNGFSQTRTLLLLK